MRTLGLDYGDVRIGVAISDPLGVTSQGLIVVTRKNPIDLSASIEQIAEIVRQYQVSVIVLGYPKNMNNSEGENCKKVLAFKDKLGRALPDIPIKLFDERLTTGRAVRVFNEVNLAKHRRKKSVDKMAAAIILQDYLDLKEKNMDFEERDFDGEDFDLTEDEFETIVMTDDEGNEAEYMVIDEFMHNLKNYLIMIKAEDADEDEAEATIFRQVAADDEEFVYEEISEDEYIELEDMLKARMAEFNIDVQ